MKAYIEECSIGIKMYIIKNNATVLQSVRAYEVSERTVCEDIIM